MKNNEISDEENKEIDKILNSRSLEDKNAAYSKTITIDIRGNIYK